MGLDSNCQCYSISGRRQDRGSQYASERHCKLIRDFQMTPSMSRKGNCWDNAAMESFFKT